MPALLKLREAITKAEQQPVEPVKSHFPPGWLEELDREGIERQQRQKN
jgi:hypothetical protein